MLKSFVKWKIVFPVFIFLTLRLNVVFRPCSFKGFSELVLSFNIFGLEGRSVK